MSEYSSAQEETNDSDNRTYMDQDMLVVNEDIVSGSRSCCESVDVSDEEILAKEGAEKDPCNKTLEEMKRIAFQKPTLSLTLVTEDEDGNVTVQTEEFNDDKHVTLIMDNEGESDETEQEKLASESVGGKEDDSVEEDLGEALKDTKVMSSLMKTKTPAGSRSTTAAMKRRMGIIVSSSDSEDDGFITKMALMPIKSDDTPVLTVPVQLDEGCLTDVENIDD